MNQDFNIEIIEDTPSSNKKTKNIIIILIIILVSIISLVFIVISISKAITISNNKKLFKEDILELTKFFDVAYNDYKNEGGENFSPDEICFNEVDNKLIMCITMKGIASRGYIKKSHSTINTWSGYIKITKESNNIIDEDYNISNGKYKATKSYNQDIKITDFKDENPLESCNCN